MSSNFKYPKSKRLLKNKDFRRLYRSSQRGSSAHFGYHVVASEQGESRLGVTVSKKVSRSAVDRNRIKREVREFFRLHQHQLANTDLVVTARASSIKVSREERQNELQKLWQKVNKWRAWHDRTQARVDDS